MKQSLASSLEPEARLRAWSYRRQRLGRAATGAAAALAEVIAVYSSHPSAPLSLLNRTGALDGAGFRELEERRVPVGIAAMRQSIFLVPALLAARLLAATRLPIKRFADRIRYAGLEWEDYERLKPHVLEVLAQPLAAGAIQEALRPELGGAEGARVMTLVRVMAYEGLVLRLGSSLRRDDRRYVATASWLAEALAGADPEQSLRWLADAYLRGFGPARTTDFAWWAGVSKRVAAAAIRAGDVTELGGGLLLPLDQQAAFSAVEPVDPEVVDVLPKWDPYTMGYAPDGRCRLVDDVHLERAYTTKASRSGATSGDGQPLVLRGGRAVASWSHRFDGDRMTVRVAAFPGERLEIERGATAVDAIGELLGASTLDLGPDE